MADFRKRWSTGCPFFTGLCLNKFGQFQCLNCPAANATAVPQVTADKPEYNPYRILIFDWALGPSGFDIRWYIEQEHRGAKLDIVNFQHLFWGRIKAEELQKIADNLKNNRYTSVYITTQDKKIRQKIRRLFQEQFGIDVHIQTYAKLVRNVNIRSMRK